MSPEKKDNSISSYLNQKNNNTKDGFGFKDIYAAILRRKKLFFLIATTFFAYSIITTVNKRYFSPLYLGSFSMLIDDPISSDTKRSVKGAGEVYENLARNTQTNDVATLIGFLKSPLVLKETAVQGVALQY